MCCHQIHTQWLAQQTPTANAEYGGKRWKEHAWVRLWNVESNGSFWCCVGLILLRRWVRERRQTTTTRKHRGARQVGQEMVQSPALPQAGMSGTGMQGSVWNEAAVPLLKQTSTQGMSASQVFTHIPLWPACEFFSNSQHPLKPRAVWLKWEGCDFAFQLPSIASNWTCRGERLILSW